MKNAKSPKNEIPSDSGKVPPSGARFDLISRADTKTDVVITLEPGSAADVTVRQLDNGGEVVSQVKTHFTTKKTSWQAWLIAAALAVYLLTRFIGLDSYPIYFFTDEAVQTVLAADLVRDNFHDYRGEVLPTYFVNGSQYNLSTSVYLQVIPYLMFGKSIWVTRGVSVLIGLLAAAAVGLAMKNVFKSRYAFAAVLLLSITPAWFLHSRTAFETVIAVSFYACFLYTYLQYRQGNIKYLWIAVLFGALCFYSYSPAQMVMAVTLLGLFLSDLKYHLKNWKAVLIGLGFALLLAIPYVRFLILHPNENIRHLEILHSYWIQEIPLLEKLGIYFKEYLKQLNPLYWFGSNQIDLERHVMKDYGNLLRWTLPLFLLGLVVCFIKVVKSQYRLLLIALLAAPSGAALAAAGITRALFMVVPAALVTAIGLDQLIAWIEKIRVPRQALTGIVFVGLAVFNGFMLRDSLVNGPLWYSDYSLGGQQYGARQIFGEIKELLKEDPNRKVFLSPSWTNGTDVLARYFFADPVPFEMGSIDYFLFAKRDIEADQVIIMLPDEIEKARASNKFKKIEVFKTLDCPNGQPCFYFTHLKYADNADEIFAAEDASRNLLNTAGLTDPNGNSFTITYPQLDMGKIENLFDGDDNSLVRTVQSNPMQMEIVFSTPIPLDRITVRIGGTESTIGVELFESGSSQALQFSQEAIEATEIRDIVFKFEKNYSVSKINLTVLNNHDNDRSHVHVWEVSFN